MMPISTKKSGKDIISLKGLALICDNCGSTPCGTFELLHDQSKTSPQGHHFLEDKNHLETRRTQIDRV